MEYDIVIIGGGVAGLSAGIYAARSGVKCLIIENNYIGGTTATLENIENYPGISSISGMDLVNTMYMQAINFGAEIQIANILDIDFKFNKINSTIGEIKYKNLIIATGTSYKKLGCECEERLFQKGISYCAVCDGTLYKNKKIIVVTDNYSGLNSINYLSNITKEIIVLDIGNNYKSDHLKYFNNVKIVSINGDDYVNSVTIEVDNNINNIDCDGVFISLGKEYKIDTCFQDLDTNKGFIVTNDKFETNIQNVYCVGDIRYDSTKQIVCACSEGAQAALNAIKRIKK